MRIIIQYLVRFNAVFFDVCIEFLMVKNKTGKNIMFDKKIFISLIFVMFLVGIGCVSAEDMDEISTLSSSDVAYDSVSLDDGMGDTIEDVESDVSTNGVDDEVISDAEPTRSTDTWGNFKAAVENTGNSIVKLNQSNIAPSSSSSDQIN